MNYRTPVKKARGLGSAQTGAAHWWLQRVTAVALAPLSLWFVISLLSVVGESYAQAVAWLGQPWNVVLMGVFMGTLFYHSWLGVKVVIEDYVHAEWLKFLCLILSQFIHFLFAAGSILAILKVAFNA